jgi:hypothetical protein
VCCCIRLTDSWIATRQDVLLFFIGISDAKAFTRQECPEWNYYEPRERDELDWDLFYVLLLERNTERALWERVGLGKVFQAAFAHGQWSEINVG